MLSVLMTSTMKSEPGAPPIRFGGISLGMRVSAAATYSFGGSAEGFGGVASSAARAGVAAAAAPAATMVVRNWRRSVMRISSLCSGNLSPEKATNRRSRFAGRRLRYLGEEGFRLYRHAAVFEGLADAVGLAACSLGLAREVDEPLRLERIAGRIANHHDARLQALRQVLADDDAGLAVAELHHASQREDADAADELLDEVAIEQRAAVLIEDAEGRGGGERLGIGPPRGERGEGIDDAGDRAHQPDFLPLELPRVAAAVVAFVVQERELRQRARELRRLAQDVGRVLDVLAQLHELVFREALALLDQRGRHAHLADVLQESQVAKERDVLRRHLEEAAEHRQVHRAIERMRLGVIALCLELGEEQHRVGVAQHALGEAVDGLAYALGIQRLARLEGREHRLGERRRGRVVLLHRRGEFLLERRLLGVFRDLGARQV